MDHERGCGAKDGGAHTPQDDGCARSGGGPRERGAAPPAAVVEALVANHRDFLAFLERRVGDRAVAEDLLQEAFVRSLDRLGELRDDDSVRAWFFRTLRNAVTDHYRRHDAAGRRLEVLAEALDPAGSEDAEAAGLVCACVSRIAGLLKPEYAEALQRVELEGVPVVAYARELGISEGNAGVRVFRARQALRREVSRSCGTCAEHGCFDCTCS